MVGTTSGRSANGLCVASMHPNGIEADTVHFSKDESCHFPQPPHTLWGSAAACDDTRRFLKQISEWHSAVRHWLAGPSASHQLSQGLIRLLLWTLGIGPTRLMTIAPYRIFPFPVSLHALSSGCCAPGEVVRQHCLDIMLWRSFIVDLLTDIWDTVGDPLFDLHECGYVVELLFMPLPVPGRIFCPDCLQHFPIPEGSAGFREHYAVCLVHRARERSTGRSFPDGDYPT